MDGDHALAEGALAAGCRFFAGYPITPSTETAERFAERCPEVGGLFIQMEDEIASITANVGAVWGGQKVMTVTSGPGFSLMMETIGLACMMETPMVLADVQRGGPSTGLPTLTAQQDMMQARWGSHGDYRIIALVPDSPQECFDLAIEAFNLSETYRVPVFIMTDETVGHMHEKVVIPPAEEIRVVERNWYTGPKEDYRPYRLRRQDGRADGQGGRRLPVPLHRPHPRRAWLPDADARDEQEARHPPDRENRRPTRTRSSASRRMACTARTSWWCPTASPRASPSAPCSKRARGPQGRASCGSSRSGRSARRRSANSPARSKAIVVPELNYGQIVLEVERCAAGQCKVISVNSCGGAVHDPEEILAAIKEGAK